MASPSSIGSSFHNLPNASPSDDSELEPNAEWKFNVRKSIEADFLPDVRRAKEERDAALSISPAEVDKIEQDYRTVMKNIRTVAETRYRMALRAERQERRFAAGLKVDERWIAEQEELLEAIQQETRPALDGAGQSVDVGVGSWRADGVGSLMNKPRQRSVSQQDVSAAGTGATIVPGPLVQDQIRGGTEQDTPISGSQVGRSISSPYSGISAAFKDKHPAVPPQSLPALSEHTISRQSSSSSLAQLRSSPEIWRPRSSLPENSPTSPQRGDAIISSLGSASPVRRRSGGGDKGMAIPQLRNALAESRPKVGVNDDPAWGSFRGSLGSGASQYNGGEQAMESQKDNAQIRKRVSNSSLHLWHADDATLAGGMSSSGGLARPAGISYTNKPTYPAGVSSATQDELGGIPIRGSLENTRIQPTVSCTSGSQTHRPLDVKARLSQLDAGAPQSYYSSNRYISQKRSFTFDDYGILPRQSPSAHSLGETQESSWHVRRESIGNQSLRSQPSLQDFRARLRRGTRKGLTPHDETAVRGNYSFYDDCEDDGYGLGNLEEIENAQIKAEEERRRREEEVKLREEKLLRREEEARRKEQEIKRKEGDVKRREQQCRIREDDAMQREHQVRIREDDAGRKEEEARRRTDVARQREEEAKRKERETRQKEEATRRREGTIAQKEEEIKKKQEEIRKREEEIMQKEDDIKRRTEETSRREEEVQNRVAEAKRREEEIKKKEVEMDRIANELKDQEDRHRRHEKQLARQEEDLRRAQAERVRADIRRQAEQVHANANAQQRQRVDSAQKGEPARKAREQEDLAHHVNHGERERGSYMSASEKAEGQRGPFMEELDENLLDENLKKEQEVLWRLHQEKQQKYDTPLDASGISMSSSASRDSSAWESAARTASSDRGSTTSFNSSSGSPSFNRSSTPAFTSASSTAQERPTSGSRGAAGAWKTSESPPVSRANSDVHKQPSTSSQSSSQAQDEESWKQRQREHARRQQEQFRRMQEKEAQARYFASLKPMTKEEVVSLFRRHDRWWKELQNMESITWSQIPWPTLRVPRTIEDLSTSAIDAYVQSPHYPDDGSKSARDRIKAQIRKWHPDRFDNLILRKVIEEDRERVQEAAGTVVRDLNELLNRRSKADALFGG